MNVRKLFAIGEYARLPELEFVSGDVAEIGFLLLDFIFEGSGIFRPRNFDDSDRIRITAKDPASEVRLGL
jgi:hypothetical protein